VKINGIAVIFDYGKMLSKEYDTFHCPVSEIIGIVV
jgi:hypothetical protein